MMFEPSPDEAAAAERLGVSLKYADHLTTIAKLTALIDELQRRLDVLERKRR